MKGKGTGSSYLLTRILATDYFYAYSNPAFFAACFFPFIAYGKNRSYYENEFEEKLLNIKENRHGNFYNYATQGFGSVAFYQPEITFGYFYQRLCLYDEEKQLYFQIQDSIGLESPNMKNDLAYVLSAETLLLKRGVPVQNKIKEELLEDLSVHENKYVMAKMLFYLVHENHMLPNVMQEVQKSVASKVGFSFAYEPNVCMGFRKTMDEDIETINARMQFATEIQLLALDGVSLFGKDEIARNVNGLFGKDFEGLLSGNSKTKMEVILSETGTQVHDNACKYQVNISHHHVSKKDFVRITLDKLMELKEHLKAGRIDIKTTPIAIPYSLFIVGFEDKDYDYIKVDLYSPFIGENKERPTLYILRRTNPGLFRHFKNVFDDMWKNDEYSRFVCT